MKTSDRTKRNVNKRKVAAPRSGNGIIPSAAKTLYELGREMLGIKPRSGNKRR